MKIYLGTLLCLCFLSSGTVADVPPYENPFISQTEASVFGISAVTGFIVPTTSNSLVQSMQTTQFYSQVSNSKGVNFNVPNRRSEYLKLMETRNIRGKAVSIEKIGDAGARQYARRMNFEPLFQGKPGQGKGFDQVYSSGKQVIVVEAKGGGSPLKQYYGYTQGTGQYSLEVAKRTLRSPTASIAEKQAAKEVIKAYKEGRLVVQVSRTKHVFGTPKGTAVETLYGKLAFPSTVKIAHQAGMTVGLAGAGIIGAFELLSQLSSGQPVDWQQVGNITALGGISGYAGAFSGTLIQRSLMNSQSQLLSKLMAKKTTAALLGGIGGGVVGGVVFSYGAYLLGYGDFKTANRSAVSGIASYGTWALGGAALGGGTAVAFATSIAGMIGATASTGTAIAGLSGAAAANATLAILGGGTLAAGGGGVAAGTVVLAGISATGVGILAVAVGGGVIYIYNLSDESTERERVKHLLTSVQNHLNNSSL